MGSYRYPKKTEKYEDVKKEVKKDQKRPRKIRKYGDGQRKTERCENSRKEKPNKFQLNHDISPDFDASN